MPIKCQLCMDWTYNELSKHGRFVCFRHTMLKLEDWTLAVVVKGTDKTEGTHLRIFNISKPPDVEIVTGPPGVTCKSPGVTGTTGIFLRWDAKTERWECRMGISLFGQSKQPIEQTREANPFNTISEGDGPPEFWDNYVNGFGDTIWEAVTAMMEEKEGMADGLWAEAEPRGDDSGTDGGQEGDTRGTSGEREDVP